MLMSTFYVLVSELDQLREVCSRQSSSFRITMMIQNTGQHNFGTWSPSKSVAYLFSISCFSTHFDSVSQIILLFHYFTSPFYWPTSSPSSYISIFFDILPYAIEMFLDKEILDTSKLGKRRQDYLMLRQCVCFKLRRFFMTTSKLGQSSWEQSKYFRSYVQGL